MNNNFKWVGLFIIAVLLNACAVNHQQRLSQEPIMQQLPQFQPFDAVVVSSPINVIISDSMSQSVTLTGMPQWAQHVHVGVINHTLHVDLAMGHHYNFGNDNIVKIQLPALHQLIVQKQAQVTVNKFNRNDLTVSSNDIDNLTISGHVRLISLINSGRGNILIRNVNTPQLVVQDSGSGQVTISGSQIGLTELTHTSNNDLTIGALIHTPLHVMIRGNGHTNLYGKHIDLRVLNYQSNTDFTLNNLDSSDLSILAMGNGHIGLNGNNNLHKLIHSDGGQVVIDGVNSDHLDILAKGYGVIKLHGNIELHNLTAYNKDDLELYGVNTGEVGILASERSQVHLSGSAALVNAKVIQSAVLDGYYLRVNRMYIKTFDNAQAHVRPKNLLAAFASDASDIYYYQRPYFIAPTMNTSGSVLARFRVAAPYPIEWEHTREYAR